MSMFLDIFAALLAWGAAAAWVLTGGDKLPPDWITYGQAAQTAQGLTRNLIPLHRRGWGR